MAYSLKNRSLLSLDELNARDILQLLALSHELKRAKAAGTEQPTLRGRNIALIFEKPSPRARCAFELAAHDQGAHVSFIGPGHSPLHEADSLKDTARMLGRLYDAIEYRGFALQTVRALAAHAGVPVYNGSPDEFHPTQVLADLMTMQEHCDKPLREMRVAWLGDARCDKGDSWLLGAALTGMDLRIAAPRALWPAWPLQAQCEALARVSGAKLTLTELPLQAVEGVDFIYTDVRASTGESDAAWAERTALLRPYQVTARLMAAAGNPSVKFMHGLPAEAMEEVFASPASIVRDQAENRMHAIKALLVATLG
jgi:ornithine carbamoyltransferase